MRNNSRNALIIVATLMLVGFIVLSIVAPKNLGWTANKTVEIKSNELFTKIKQKAVAEVTWQGSEIRGTLSDGQEFKTTYFESSNPASKTMIDELNANGIPIKP